MSPQSDASKYLSYLTSIAISIIAVSYIWLKKDKKKFTFSDIILNKTANVYLPPPPTASPSTTTAASSSTTAAAPTTTADKNISKLVVEDIDEDGEDDEADGEDEDNGSSGEQARLLQLKEQYTGLTSKADKYHKGGLYLKAAETYSEAIKLVNVYQPASADLVLLYNNRSAMYEKHGDLDNSLADIRVILSMEPTHERAHGREARICEAQGKLSDALIKYTIQMILQRHAASINQYEKQSAMEKRQQALQQLAEKMDYLAKKVAATEAKKYLSNDNSSTVLATKSVCRNFFDTYPSTHQWILKYKGANIKSLNDSDGHIEGERNDETNLNAILQTTYYYIANGSYSKAFENIAGVEIADIDEDISIEYKKLISKVLELRGVEKQLKRNYKEARALYERAIAYDSGNFESTLKIASIMIDNEDRYNDAVELFDQLLATYSSDDLITSWIYINRTVLWLMKDETASLRPDALANAIKDISDVVKLTEQRYLESDEYKAARLIGLIRLVFVKQQKLQMDLNTMSNEEEMKEVARDIRKLFEKAKELNPNHDSIPILDVDTSAMTSTDGAVFIDQALKLIDQSIEKAAADDSILYVFKCNWLVQKMNVLHHQLQMSGGGDLVAQSSLADTIKEADSIYNHAIEIEPQSVEALGGYANFRLMAFEDYEKSYKYGMLAIGNARSKDEVVELFQSVIICKAHVDATASMKVAAGV